jgi:electron transport complex protein RnfG
MAHGSDKNESLFKVAANLMIACLLSGTVLSGVFAITAPAAAAQQELRKQRAMQTLVGGAEFKEIEGKTEWYEAVVNGKLEAYIVPAQHKGYEGVIRMVAAISPEGKVLNFQVVSHKETPGLGDKFYDPKFYVQFQNKEPDDLLKISKVPREGFIQAMTGATITTRALANGIREVALEVKEYIKTQKK